MVIGCTLVQVGASSARAGELQNPEPCCDAPSRTDAVLAGESLSQGELDIQRAEGAETTPGAFPSDVGDLAVILWDEFRTGARGRKPDGSGKFNVTVTVNGLHK